MKRRKTIFRADGNSEIGLGHIIRSLALAEMLKNDFVCEFATRFSSDFIQREINKVCSKTHLLPQDNDLHFAHFLELLEGDEIVVLDNYFFTTDYQRKIKEKGCKLVCIDDLADKQYLADLIINHSPGFSPNDYKAMPNTQYALGIEYVLIRSAFLAQARKNSTIDKIETVMICFGGSDPLNLTEKVLKAIIKVTAFKKVIVITGSANNSIESILELIKSDDRIEHRQSLNQQQMLQTMLESELAIVPASGILFELMSVGVPSIIGYFVDNQQKASLNIGTMGLAYNIGDLLNDLDNKLNAQIKEITIESAQKMILRQKSALKNSDQLHINNFKKLM